MGKVSDFFRSVRFDYLGAADRDWIERTAKYYNFTNPPTLPLDYSRIRARENILIAQMNSQNYQYAKNAYSIPYLKSIPLQIVEGLIGKRTYQSVMELGYDPMFDPTFTPKLQTDEQYFGKFQSEMGRIVSQALFSFLNSTDQSIWYEWLLRMDRGAANDRDMFLGVFDRGSVLDVAKAVNAVGAAAIIGYVGWSFAASGLGSGAAVATGETAATTSAAAVTTGAATEAGTLAGSSGLLGEGLTVTAFEGAGAAAGGGLTVAEGGGLLGSVIAATEQIGGSALAANLTPLINSVLNPPKAPTQTVAPVQTQSDSKIELTKFIPPLAVIISLLFS